MPIAIGIGYWCDGRFNSAPIGLFAGTAIGFAAMLLRIVRMRPNDATAQEAEQGGALVGDPSDRIAAMTERAEPKLGTESTEPETPEREEESDR